MITTSESSSRSAASRAQMRSWMKSLVNLLVNDVNQADIQSHNSWKSARAPQTAETKAPRNLPPKSPVTTLGSG